ncbi:LAS superfamily LD-carboxypeptidase LdcB [Gracilibacillus halotolerans]|uniref:LAS superfamily LD-carboxypeptidase LdcB n=1 Tax=Gracilibacillus halotolerans TaxID=74386 RepID=A0A841RF53_9BACI|nr:M15 family metallopeptidase [Gracilibacillus halotolerans]MBB6512680.1 LAS superfamily LD-carboxypeptidase LdcB [Gracilibacillus halotolerans]
MLNRNKKWLISGSFIFVVLIAGCEQLGIDWNSNSNNEQENQQIEESVNNEETLNREVEQDENNEVSREETDTNKEETEEEAIETVLQRDENGLVIVPNPESIEVIVNKERRLPEGYEPPDLVEPDVEFHAGEGDPKRQMRQEAAHALEELFAIAEKEGIELVAVSGYRSYNRQEVIYNNSVEKNGEEHANQYSAKPGTSEHQTGLAMDVASSQRVSVLEPSFIDTDEGQWLDENAHRAGFIIRYPDGKENITGYNYEPWHLRYVGKELATEIYKQQLTLEEFFGLFNE